MSKLAAGSLGVALALLCLCSSVAAAEGGRELEVRGGSSCVNAPSLRARLARYLGAGAAPDELTIEVDLVQEPPGFRLWRAGELVAERRFERLPVRCAERRDAIALALAVAVEHALPPESPEPGPPPPMAASPATPLASPSAPAPQRTAADQPAAEAAPPAERAAVPPAEVPQGRGLRPSPRWLLFAGAAYLFEALPAPSGALKLGTEYALVPALRLGIAAVVSARVELPFEGGRVETQLFGGQFTACANAPAGPVILLGCAGASAAYVNARGREYTREHGADIFWLAALVRAGVELPATSAFALRLVASLHANLLRPELSLNRVGAAPRTHSVSPIGGSGGADILVRFD